jgi:aerobic-type carbon monoxide dehydrogenase small subunit (CoxS/CutS family)
MEIEVTVNGQKKTWNVAPDALLLDVLRDEGYVSVKRGCGEGECGVCTILFDGQRRNSCLMLAGQAHGHEITTVEGLGTTQNPHPIQKAFVETGAVQCGFCTPGMVLATKALLDRHPDPTDEQIRMALDGNLCRCTGYVKILDAVRLAAARLRGESTTAVEQTEGAGGAR